jgi:cysteine-rich repeat protein
VHFENAAARDGWAATWAPVAFGVCGDGLRDVAEACDDGNTASGDGCSATCAIEASFACAGGSETHGPDFSTRLYAGQTGQIQQAFYGSNAALSWRVAPAGVHSLQLDFSAFDLANDFVSISSCVDAGCGQSEQVGLRMSGGVARSVRTSTGFALIRLTSDSSTNGAGFTMAWGAVGQKRCGNRFRDLGEECDDGNAIPGDGCSVSCAVETMWSCTGATALHGPDTCARLITAQGTLTDGSGAENYTANAEFWWVLSPQGVVQVQLSLVVMDLHHSDTLQVS